MKKYLAFFSFILCTYVGSGQDIIYTVSNYTSPGIRQITGVDPDNGTGGTATSYATGDGTTLSAAMALANNGYLYYIPYTESNVNNGGVIQIYSIAANPSSAPSSQEVFNDDINGTTTATAICRTMAAAPDGWIYLTYSDESGNISLARFQPGIDTESGQGTVENFELRGTFTLNNTSPAGTNLRNGDIAFDGSGNLYVLINEDEVGSDAVIYFAPQSAISSTSDGETNLVTKYAVVSPEGGNFREYVVGLAVSSTGNFYIAVQDDADPSQGGVYLLTRSNDEFVVSGIPVSDANARDIADLATGYFPASTILPVVYGSIAAKVANGSLMLNWSTLSETNNARFEIEVSADGESFTSIGTVNSKAVNGNSDRTIDYHFSKSVDMPVAAMGISLFSLAFGLLLAKKRNKALLSVVMIVGAGLAFASCSKSGDQVDVSGDSKLFVRIVQVDKDGKKSTSKVITAYRAD
ncbi:hypothetical protein U0035_11955 [Niabella yanshanensis]|uniref:Uncharacterized protein n=1 Tax=Niabella yanshanensis TaxID=577386 RepID=A0ABZ0W0X7_9BACT|nr:hypothetical protein [Niabella yanshanensis]WQD36379.1 hypothetical protein U0035_11955 [Niabella yanshanensis]